MDRQYVLLPDAEEIHVCGSKLDRAGVRDIDRTHTSGRDQCIYGDAMKQGIVSRIICALVIGAIGATIPSIPIFLISSFVDDQPAFWVWPMFTLLLGFVVFLTDSEMD